MNIRYVSWRNGRPRFQPGRGPRILGFKGQDLRHQDTGQWFTAEEAQVFSADIGAKIAEARGGGRIPERIPGPFRRLNAKQRVKTGPGYVYFLISGQSIKIGYSRNPMARALSLGTALSHGVQSLSLVQGTEHEERQLHRALKHRRQRGEWFSTHDEVLRAAFQCIKAGRIIIPENKNSSTSRTPSEMTIKSCVTDASDQKFDEAGSIVISEG